MAPTHRHPFTPEPPTSSPESESTLGPTFPTEADAEAKAEAETTAARMRADINRILERRPPTEEELEQLTLASHKFYQHAMELKRQRRRRRARVCLVLGVVGGLGWCVYSYMLG